MDHGLFRRIGRRFTESWGLTCLYGAVCLEASILFSSYYWKLIKTVIRGIKPRVTFAVLFHLRAFFETPRHKATRLPKPIPVTFACQIVRVVRIQKSDQSEDVSVKKITLLSSIAGCSDQPLSNKIALCSASLPRTRAGRLDAYYPHTWGA